ncbi:MAG: TIGR00341 family protein [Spirulinaceae cyanobacterium]
MSIRQRLLVILARCRSLRRKIWRNNSGQWRWLKDKQMSVVGLNRLLWRASVPSSSFFVMLMISGVISTAGLLANSVATVIGAMIIAPLMGPIIGLSYSLAISNRRLMRRASLTLLLGTVATIFSAALFTWIIGLREVTPEILARVQPTLIDLLVAIAAGAAGAYAKSHPQIADSFPGVAIAVALVPPLGVVGIGLALGSQHIFLDSLLLFATNLIGTIVSGVLVFIWQDYGSLKRARKGLAFSLLILLTLGIPLTVSLNRLLTRSSNREEVRHIIRHELPALLTGDLHKLEIEAEQDSLEIRLEINAVRGSISEADVAAAQRILAAKLEKPVALAVVVIPIEEFMIPAQ